MDCDMTTASSLAYKKHAQVPFSHRVYYAFLRDFSRNMPVTLTQSLRHRSAVALAPVVFALALLCAGPAMGQTPASPPAPAADTDYVAQRGDTVIGIARRLLIDGRSSNVQRALIRHNRLRDADVITPGQVLRIPENWLRSAAARIEIIGLTGDVQSDGEPPRLKGAVPSGRELRTGPNGTVTIKMPDNSTVTLQPDSSMRVERAAATAAKPQPDSVFQLIRGRVEAVVEKRDMTGARFEVRTPVAVAAVRGTRFRVTMNEDARASTTEVTEGAVQFSDTAGLGSVPVPDGFGTRALAGSAPDTPRALLAAPRIWTGIRLVPRSPLAINFLALNGAVSYRIRISRDRDSRDLVSETLSTVAQLRIEGLPNGEYFARIRGIDNIGLEGRDSVGELLVLVTAPAPAAPAPTPATAPSATDAPAAPAAPAGDVAPQAAPATPITR